MNLFSECSLCGARLPAHQAAQAAHLFQEHRPAFLLSFMLPLVLSPERARALGAELAEKYIVKPGKSLVSLPRERHQAGRDDGETG